MNFLSKLILVVITLLVTTVTTISIKLYDLINCHAILNNKIDKVNNKISLISIKSETQKISLEQKNECFGIDVSHWNGNIVSEIPDKDNISFIICKATQGNKSVDSDFKVNWIEIKKLNKIRGAYHFYIYGDDPLVQANHFCEVVNNLEQGDMSLILDIEELSLPKTDINVVKLRNDVTKFLEIVELKIHKKPIIYTDYSFASKYLNDVKFSKYPLWLAEYSNIKTPTIPVVWRKTGCMIWQKKDNYNINSTKEDYDVFFGKKEELLALGTSN